MIPVNTKSHLTVDIHHLDRLLPWEYVKVKWLVGSQRIKRLQSTKLAFLILKSFFDIQFTVRMILLS